MATDEMNETTQPSVANRLEATVGLCSGGEMRFCKPMKRHYITTAAGNAAIALNMAKELQAVAGHMEGVQDLVHVIDLASRKLIRLCESHAYKVQEGERSNASLSNDVLKAEKG